MKIKKIGAICAKEKTFELLTKTGEDAGQWLGDGEAFYRIDGLPELTSENIPFLFDISVDKAADMQIEHNAFPDSLDVAYYAEERELVPAGQTITDVAGRVLMPMSTGNGLCYLVQGKYLNVLDEEVGYFLRRKPSGTPYIAARAGMFVIAIFRPYFDTENNLASWLSTIAQQMKNTKLTDAVAMEVKKDGD